MKLEPDQEPISVAPISHRKNEFEEEKVELELNYRGARDENKDNILKVTSKISFTDFLVCKPKIA